MEIISRETWGARRTPGPRTRPLPLRRMFLHHSGALRNALAGKVGTPASERAAMRELEEIGYQRFGAWGYGISYTFVVFPSGRVYEGHPVHYVGAHTAGHNTEGAGICWAGDYTQRGGTALQVKATAELVNHLRAKGQATTNQLAGGHRDVFATACPGNAAYPQVRDVNATAKRLAKQAPKVDPAPQAPRTPNGIHTVKRGDTLGVIARNAGTSVAALVLLNGISNPDRIEVGQRIYTRWVVGRGQTLSGIAERVGTTVAALVKRNNIDNPNRIEVGQLLRLP